MIRQAVSSVVFLSILPLCVFAFGEEKGSIQVRCEPGIAISLDSTPAGTTSEEYEGLIIQDAPAGAHKVTALKEGCAPQVREIAVENGLAVVVEFPVFLPAEKTALGNVGIIEFRTLPVECRVCCPGVGITSFRKTRDPWTLWDVPLGTHDLSIKWNDKSLNLTMEIKRACKTVVTANFLKMEISAVIGEPTILGPIALVPIKPGSFRMGSEKGGDDEKPVHQVSITKTFYIGVAEITQAQYAAVTGSNPSRYKGDDLPVASVGWDDAMEFCRLLTESERKNGNLPVELEYRLPTEAEWEYCCRAGSDGEFCFGDDMALLTSYAWFEKNSIRKPHPVATKKANAWGLSDMHGNVMEWCLDWYAGQYEAGAQPQADPGGPKTGDYRVIRGGGWDTIAGFCRASYRLKLPPGCHFLGDVGFRVVAAQTSVRQ